MPNIGTDLNRYILEEERKYPSATGSLSIALMAIETATKIISSHVRMAGLAEIFGKAVSVQGEEVQKLDEFANNVLIRILSDSGQFYAIASKQLGDVIYAEKGREGKYIVAIDPIDGSGNIDVNAGVGTIFSIYGKNTGTHEDFLQGGDKQISSASSYDGLFGSVEGS
ncbi:MAG: hypothetical protein HQK96_20975 [Nitrospirae bacterium]|nr:hypothetical protein [Nitrospirota bacterium]